MELAGGHVRPNVGFPNKKGMVYNKKSSKRIGDLGDPVAPKKLIREEGPSDPSVYSN